MAPASARFAIRRIVRCLSARSSVVTPSSLPSLLLSLASVFGFPAPAHAETDSAHPVRRLRLGLSATGVISRDPGAAAARARFDSRLDLVAANADVVWIAARAQEWFLAWESVHAFPYLERRKLELAIDYGSRGLTAVIDVGFWRTIPSDPPSLRLVPAPGGDPALDVLDPELRRRWLRLVELVAGELRPAYLCLGTNLNLVEAGHGPSPPPGATESTPAPESSREARRALLVRFADLAGEATERVRRVSPRTRVVVGFHHERMRRTGEFDLVSEIDWDVDTIGFSLWPGRWQEDPPAAESLARVSPARSAPSAPSAPTEPAVTPDMGDPPPPPADYLDPLFASVRLPVAFLDVGWTARPEEAAETLGQEGFLQRLSEWTVQHEVELVRWRELEDVGSPDGSDDRILYGGLLDRDGRPKPAWRVWQGLVEAARR